MTKFKLEYDDVVEDIEADYVLVEGEAVVFYIRGELCYEIIAIRPLCAVTQEGVKTELRKNDS